MMEFLSKILNLLSYTKPEKIFRDYGKNWFIEKSNNGYDLYHEIERYDYNRYNEKFCIEHKLIYIGHFKNTYNILCFCFGERLGRRYQGIYDKSYEYIDGEFHIGDISFKLWNKLPYYVDSTALKFGWVCDFLKHPEYLEIDNTIKSTYTDMRFMDFNYLNNFIEKYVK